MDAWWGWFFDCSTTQAHWDGRDPGHFSYCQQEKRSLGNCRRDRPGRIFRETLRSKTTPGGHRPGRRPRSFALFGQDFSGPAPCKIMKRILIVENDDKIALPLTTRPTSTGHPTWVALDGI